MTQIKGLGRGLDVLLGSEPEKTVNTLAVDELVPGKYQPRSNMDTESLTRLCESIRKQGIIQPILVRKIYGGKYEIIAGERRWRAAKQAGLNHVPVQIREVEDENALVMALIENIQREDLNPLEEAQGIARLIEEFGLTHQAAAEAVGRSRSAVSNLLRLMQLSSRVQGHLLASEIDMGHARALLALDFEHQDISVEQVINKKLTVRQTEALVARQLNGFPRKAIKKSEPEWFLSIKGRLGFKARLKTQSGGQGTLVIDFQNEEEIKQILARFSP
ncbi:MAG: ParB/RepB/Spo0J family partition protein [Proteobacteria bacterium]|nr:ParB/RepB/Spo0J family partition protein [Pseudomonadota bacterium]MDE3208860.1 ParB/RepB/Spo0J family partition protein [Pseudomonadota bacterium]